jgi:hypothetical protein
MDLAVEIRLGIDGRSALTCGKTAAIQIWPEDPVWLLTVLSTFLVAISSASAIEPI